jgi:hypothetical protein
MLFDPVHVSPRLLYNGQVMSLIVLSCTLLYLGYPDQARLKMNQALFEARRSNSYTLTSVLMYALYVEWRLSQRTSSFSVQKSLLHLDMIGARAHARYVFATDACRIWDGRMRARGRLGRPCLIFALRDCSALCHSI